MTKKPMPSFLRLGQVQIHLRYEGQTITCRQCNKPGHMANDCHVNQFWFNCDGPVHVLSDCPHPVCYHFCHEENHKTRECPFSPTSPRSVKSGEEIVPRHPPLMFQATTQIQMILKMFPKFLLQKVSQRLLKLQVHKSQRPTSLRTRLQN